MTRLLVAWALILWALPAAAEPVQVFVQDLKVDLKGWTAGDAEALGKALAADLQAAIAKNPAFSPMTFENLKSQLRREKQVQALSCSADDQSCLQKMIDNFGCEERLFGTVLQVGDQAQVSLTRYRNDKLVPGGAVSAYAKPGAQEITETAKRLAREMFGGRGATGDGGARMEEGRIDSATQDWAPDLDTGVVVSFASDPTGALVEVDGDVLCNAPCSKTVTKATHRVAMKMARYRTWEGDLDAARKTTVNGTLAPTFGWLTVRSTPDGLGVTVNGKSVGKTPLAAAEMDPGPYEVLVDDERYETEGQRVQLDAGEKEVVDLAPKPKEGALKVEVVDDKGNAVTAELWVDGQKVGTAPWAGKVMVGEHAVEARTADGSVAEKRVVAAYRAVCSETIELRDMHSRSHAAAAAPPSGPLESAQDELSPLEEYPTEDYELVMIIAGTTVPKAIIVGPDGRRYVVRKNDRIGNRNGLVEKITEFDVIIREPSSAKPVVLSIRTQFKKL